MKKKNRKSEIVNLIFSAFLVTAFMACSSFFLGMINDSFAEDAVKRVLLVSLVFALFGGLLFYATRVGDGKQVFRFSAATLIIMVLPALYVILASAFEVMPLHEQISAHGELAYIAAVIFGYGLPYTFLSGYELDCGEKKPAEPVTEEETEEETEEDTEEAAEEAEPASDDGVQPEEPSDEAAGDGDAETPEEQPEANA